MSPFLFYWGDSPKLEVERAFDAGRKIISVQWFWSMDSFAKCFSVYILLYILGTSTGVFV